MNRVRLPQRLAVFGIAFALCSPAFAAPWHKLTPAQQKALAPLSSQWNKLPENEQRLLLRVASKYRELTPEQKARLHKRLLRWSLLTPEQRARARQKYKAFNKVPLATREQVKRMIREQEAEKAQAGPSSTDK